MIKFFIKRHPIWTPDKNRFLGTDGNQADQQTEYDQSTSDSGNGNRAGSESRTEFSLKIICNDITTAP